MNQIWKSCVSLLFVFALTGSEIANASNVKADKKETESSWPSFKTIALTGGLAAGVAIILSRVFAKNVGAANAGQVNAQRLPPPVDPVVGLAGAGVAMFGGAPQGGNGGGNPPPAPCCGGAEAGNNLHGSVLPVDGLLRGDFEEHQLVVENAEAEQFPMAFMTPDRARAPAPRTAQAEDDNLIQQDTPSARNFAQHGTPAAQPGSNQLTFRVRIRDSLDFARVPPMNLDAADQKDVLEDDDASDNELARTLVESLLTQAEEEPAEQTVRHATPLTGRTITVMFEGEIGDEEQHEIVRQLQTPNRDGNFLELQGENEIEIADAVVAPVAVAAQAEEPILVVVEAPANNNAVEVEEEKAPAPAKTPKTRARTVRKPTKADRRAAEEAQRMMSTIKPRTERKKPLRSYKDESDNEEPRKSDSDGDDFGALNKKLF